MATALLTLQIGNVTERAFIPLADEHDNALPDALILDLMRQACPTLFYVASGTYQHPTEAYSLGSADNGLAHEICVCRNCGNEYAVEDCFCSICGRHIVD